jgi:hypothetical protein
VTGNQLNLKSIESDPFDLKTVLESADQAQISALTREDLLGDMFHAGGLGYYAQLTALSYLMGLQIGGHQTLAAGTGTFGYEPNVNYFFGFPRSIKPGGVVFDIPWIKVSATDDGNADKLKQFNLQTGLLSSALEHAVPEQMFVNEQNPGEAISAVKALQKANAAGQRIYHITQANQATILTNIHHHPDTMAEIKNALNAGKEVITHTDAVSVPGWSGAGYIITDTVTGDGAYKISGGGNGGTFIVGELYGFAIGYTSVYIGAAFETEAWPYLVGGLAVLIEMLTIAYAAYEYYGYVYDSLAQQCFLTGLGWGLSSAGLTVEILNKLVKSPISGGLPTAILGFIFTIVTSAYDSGAPAKSCIK